MKYLTFVGALVCWASTSVSAQTVTNKRLVASDTLQASALIERTTDVLNSVGDPLKEFVIFYGGTIRLKWQIKSNGGTSGVRTFVRPASDPNRQLCYHESSSSAYTTVTCDVPAEAGTTLQIRLFSNDGNPVALRNARLFFDLVQSSKSAVAITN